jgi:hypothetical protein
MQRTNQDVVMDVMSAVGEKFLVSISSPVELKLIYHIKSQKREDLGNAIQAHVSTLRSHGFEPKMIFVEFHRMHFSLENAYPGVAMDASGAGNKARIKDLATYVVGRINLKRTQALADNVAPHVKFTGVRPDFDKKYGLSFGDYVECYDPKSHQILMSWKQKSCLSSTMNP